jgi:hypothetical protein
VIRMARVQRRRVRLNWSVRRWQDEHDRLARAETLARLAEQNVQYSLPEFIEHLPPKFNGYLIRSSRRLGMEGLRQRHCVASYHEALKAGNCVLASLFVQRRRWTVEIIATGKPDAPLRVQQVKTRFDKAGGVQVRNAVQDMLGIKRAGAVGTAGETDQQHVYMENLRVILPVLRERGVTAVTVNFEGSGDEGTIDSVSFDGAELNASAVRVEVSAVERHFDEGRWIYTRQMERTDLESAIRDLTDDYLEETSINWYDGQGGFGELVINVSEETVQLTINGNYTESSPVYEAKSDILTGEEI